ncbi:MAG: hypothetical protein KAG37_09495 [Flavobacteriales bacterium]|nr:hypothetical protein [Flavobacteriales bacterium]
MKKYIYIILLIYASNLYSFPDEGGHSADLNINTQKELDDLEYIEEVGNLIIASEGVDQIIDLSNLRSIKRVNGSIYVINNSKLSALDGISVFVDGDVIIQRNKSLERLTPNFIKGNVRNINIKDNESLQNVVGFDQIESVNSVSVEFNNSLVDLNGLSSLKEISGDVTISNNDELKYFQPFVDIVYFNGALKVNNNKSLYDADGLYKLQSMATRSELKNNTIYTTDLGLMKVIYEGKGKLKFTNQQELDLFGQCYNKKSFKGDIIIDKSSITNINALKVLNEIDGRLIIKRNDNLVSIEGLSQLVSIDNLIISFNKNLGTLSGLENLSTVKNNVVIYRNTFLTDTSSISDDISLGGKLVIKSNPRLNK